MEWINNMSLKKSFFVIITAALTLSILLSGLFYEICNAAIDYFALSKTVHAPLLPDALDQSGYLITFDGGTAFNLEAYYIYHVEPWYSIVSFSQLIVPILLVIGSLLLADILFYRLKLKQPIYILHHSAERIQEQDLDFEIESYSSDELGRLCAAFELMRQTLLANNQKLWRQAEERKRLNAAFSHDLRNPLTVLKGSAKMAKRCAADRTEKTELLIENLERIENYTLRLERYAEVMSKVGMLEQIQLERTAAAPHDLVCGLENAMRLMAADWGKQLLFSSSKIKEELLIDKNALFQIAENLAANALRFARQTVAVSLSHVGEMLILNVSDDGSGFPAELLRNGIQPFQRRYEDAEHFGMGLYICDLLCQKHGGYMEIKNGEQGASVCAALKIS